MPQKKHGAEGRGGQARLRGKARRASYFTKNGESYMYSGPLYEPHCRVGTPKKTSAIRTASAFSVFFMLVICGCIPIPGMNAAYVIIPYVCAIITSGVILKDALKMHGQDSLREYVYESTAKNLPYRAVFSAVFSALCAVGENIFIIVNDAKYTVAAAIFTAFSAMSVILSLLIHRGERIAVWEKRGSPGRAENNSKKSKNPEKSESPKDSEDSKNSKNSEDSKNANADEASENDAGR